MVSDHGIKDGEQFSHAGHQGDLRWRAVVAQSLVERSDLLVFNLWDDATRNLQRVDFRKLPTDILVQFVTAIPRFGSDAAPILQMDRRLDAATEMHMTCLDGRPLLFP